MLIPAPADDRHAAEALAPREDDHPEEAEIVDLLAMLLAGDGRTILGAYNGEQALEIVREQRPELVISDVMMPGLDGRELCRIIKSEPELASTSIVLMSAVHKLDLRGCTEGIVNLRPFRAFAFHQAGTSGEQGPYMGDIQSTSGAEALFQG